MKNQKYRQLTDLAAEQFGVFSRANARTLRIPDSTLSDGVANGRYHQIGPSVFVVAGAPASLQQRMVATALSMPGLAAISHRSAAEMWGLTNRGIRRIEVVTTRWDRVPRDDATVHESGDLIQADITDLGGIPVTTAVRTIVDLGATSPWAVERAMEAGIRRGLFTQGEVEALVARVARKGRRGVGVIRPLLAARRKWDRATESALEDLFRKAVDGMGLPQPRPQHVVRDDLGGFVCRADFAYPHELVLIELDSEAHHMDRITFRRDRSKQNTAVGLGWTVLRFTWWDLRERPYEVGAHLKAVLRSGRTLASGVDGAGQSGMVHARTEETPYESPGMTSPDS